MHLEAVQPADPGRGIAADRTVLTDETLDHYEFGGKLATQLGANLSDDSDDAPKNAERFKQAETRMAAAARPKDWKAEVAAMSMEERTQATLECLERKNNQKEILADLLAYCEQERTEQEAESFLEAHKQFCDGHHSASKYLLFLARTGGLEELEYDGDGLLITEELREEMREAGATDEELEDLAVEWHYLTTEAGIKALELFSPAKRSKDLIAHQKPSRHESFARLLGFCREPRSLADIVAFMDGDPGLEMDPRTGVMQMQPSAYIGLLDQAGALTWEEGGWHTTEGGMEALNAMNLE